MNTILVHLGCQGPYIDGTQPPAHMLYCIEQFRRFNTSDLYVLTDNANIPHVPSGPGIFAIPVEGYKNDKLKEFESKFNYAANEFWSVSTTRFFYMEEFVKKHRLAPVVHFENDVLIYFNISSQARNFKGLYGPGLALTPCDDDQATSGFMYIGSFEVLAHMTRFITDMLRVHGVHGFEKHHRVHMMNDMTLMRRYADTRGAGGVHFLPVLPFGPHSQGYETFRAIFDPGDFGQYIGGTRGGGPGVTYEGHYVGGVLRHNPDYEVIWQDGFPYFKHNGKLARFNSLHIHSKNMEQFMSHA